MRAVGVLALVAWSGCAPLLTLTHRDLKHERVEISVDERPVGQLLPGQRLQVRVERGPHQLGLRDAASGRNEWTDDGRPAVLLVEGDVEVTLTQPTEPR